MNKKFRILIIVLMSLLFLFSIIFIFKNKTKNRQNLQRHLIVSAGNCRFTVEVADNFKSRKRGLSERNELCDNCGMFFSFLKTGMYGFWMKKMLFPIDLIWLRDDVIVGFKKNFSKNSKEIIYPPQKINRVLEINSGKIEKCNILIGDSLRINKK